MKKSKNNVFYINVFTVVFIQILIKIVGMFYNIFLTNNKNYLDIGNGIFMSAHQIYILFLTVSIVGIPTSIARIVASKNGNDSDIQKIIDSSLAFWGIIGVVESIILIIFSRFIAINILCVDNVELILKILAIGIPFVNYNAVYRGVLNGIEKNQIGVFIQFVEQFIKVIFTVVFVYILKRLNIESRENILYIVSFGVTFSVILTFFIYSNRWKKYKTGKNSVTTIRYIDVIKEVFKYSIPITIVGIFGTVNKNIDLFSIMNMLKGVYDINVINEKYGIIISKVDVLINFPIGLNSAITLPLLTRISKYYSERNFQKIEEEMNLSIKLSMKFAIPIFLMFFIFSSNILNILYPNANDGADLLRLSGILIVINVFMQIVMVYYNAVAKTGEIIKIFSLGAIIKLVLNIILINIPGIYEKGVIVSSILSDIVIILFLVRNKVFRNNIIFFENKELISILMESIIYVLLMKIIEMFVIYFLGVDLTVGFVFGFIIVFIIYVVRKILKKVIFFSQYKRKLNKILKK